MKRWALYALSSVLPSFPAMAASDIMGTATVIDGDIIKIRGTRVRMHRIDAPESRQECVRAD